MRTAFTVLAWVAAISFVIHAIRVIIGDPVAPHVQFSAFAIAAIYMARAARESW